MREETTVRTKFALGFFALLVVVAIGLRVKLHYFPAEPVETVFDDEEVYAQIEQTLFGQYENIRETAPEEEAGRAVPPQEVKPVSVNSSVLSHVYTHQLGAGRLPYTQPLDSGYVQSYVSGQELFLQRYDAVFAPTGQPTLVGNSISELDVPAYQPQLAVNEKFVVVFSIRASGEQLAQQFTMFDHELNVVREWRGLTSDANLASNQNAKRDIAAARVALVDSTVVVATQQEDKQVSVMYYDESGQLLRERIVQNIGNVRAVLTDQQKIILVSQLEKQIVFSKIINETNAVQKFIFENPSEDVAAALQSGPYVFIVDQAASILPLAENLLQIYNVASLTQSTAMAQSIGINNTKLFVSYAVPVTEVQADQTVTAYQIYVDEYEINLHDTTQ